MVIPVHVGAAIVGSFDAIDPRLPRLAHVHGHEAHARLDEFSPEQVALAAVAFAIAGAHPLRLALQIEGLAGLRIRQHILRLLEQRVHRRHVFHAAAVRETDIKVAQ